MNTATKATGIVLFWGAGLVMVAFELYWFAQWWGGVGVVVGLFVPPIVALFPFIYLFLEGFSALYFGVWALGLVGTALVVRASES